MGTNHLTSLMADLHQAINRDSLFSRCLNGTFPCHDRIGLLRHGYISPNENKTNTNLLFQINLPKTNRALEHLLQGIVPLIGTCYMQIIFQWRKAAFNEVNDWALGTNIKKRPFT